MREIVGYHITWADAAENILKEGFVPSDDGTIGEGVYIFSGTEDKVIFRAMLHVIDYILEGFNIPNNQLDKYIADNIILLKFKYSGKYTKIQGYDTVYCCHDTSGFSNIGIFPNWSSRWEELYGSGITTIFDD